MIQRRQKLIEKEKRLYLVTTYTLFWFIPLLVKEALLNKKGLQLNTVYDW